VARPREGRRALVAAGGQLCWARDGISAEANMAISVEELYKHAFEEHRFASEIRFKILAACRTSYTALAAVFLWCQTSAKRLSWLVPLVGSGLTVLFWLGDIRNRRALGRSKAIGCTIEEAASSGIPRDLRFFGELDSRFRHGQIIDGFAIAMVILLSLVAACLFMTKGTVPS
jgi:hypothetical protein